MGELPQEVLWRIETLSLEQLESLKEALLDFQTIAQGIMAKPNADLEAWFSTSE